MVKTTNLFLQYLKVSINLWAHQLRWVSSPLTCPSPLKLVSLLSLCLAAYTRFLSPCLRFVDLRNTGLSTTIIALESPVHQSTTTPGKIHFIQFSLAVVTVKLVKKTEQFSSVVIAQQLFSLTT